MDTNYCTNCGNKLENNENFCTKCGSANKNNNIIFNNSSNGNILGFISLGLYFGSGILYFFIDLNSINNTMINYWLSYLLGFCPLAGIVVMIVGRVKYPSNKLLKISMWIIIVSVLIIIVLMIFFIILWYITCNSIIVHNCG